MRRPIRLIATIGLALMVALGVGGVWLADWYERAGPLTQPAVQVFERGAGFQAIGRQLAAAGIIRHPALFASLAWLTRDKGALLSGEYQFPAAISPHGVLDLLRSGHTIIHKLVVPEGRTSAEALALVEHAEALTGVVETPPGEGEILPATYSYSWGDQRQALIDRMRRGMRAALAELWANRAPNLPLTSPEQAVILASIIEKETGVPAERAEIAGVFYNRLRLGMRLQSDPTVIYGLTLGKFALDRPLVHEDLRIDSPYNTYVIKGLPPGPIGNPGRAALKAALQPASTDALYFVADGSGGHAFAATLEEHNKNVARWRDRPR